MSVNWDGTIQRMHRGGIGALRALAAAVASLVVALGCSSGDGGDAESFAKLRDLSSQLRSSVPVLGQPAASHEEGRRGFSADGTHLYEAYETTGAEWPGTYGQLVAALEELEFTSTVPSTAGEPPESPSQPRNFTSGDGLLTASVLYYPDGDQVQLGTETAGDLSDAAHVVVAFSETS